MSDLSNKQPFNKQIFNKQLKNLLAIFFSYIVISYPIWIDEYARRLENDYRINSKKELEEVINREKKKLGITRQFEVIIYKNNELEIKEMKAYAGREKDNVRYFLGVNKHDINEIVIKHELYHLIRDLGITKTDEEIIKMNFDYSVKPPNKYLKWLKDFYISEPRADIYSVTGIKL